MTSEVLVDWSEQSLDLNPLYFAGLSLPDSEDTSYHYVIRLTDGAGNVSSDLVSPSFIAGPILSFANTFEEYSVHQTMAKVELTLSRPVAQTVTVSVKANSGSALAGIDYYFPNIVSEAITIPAGATSASTYVSVLAAPSLMVDKNFEIEITSATNSVIDAFKLPITLVGYLGMTSTVSDASGYKAIYGSRGHMCALTTQDKLECWGGTAYDNGATSTQFTPKEVAGLGNIAKISRGAGGHTCTIDTVGDLYCFGNNSFTALGDGSYANHASGFKHPTLANLKKVTTGVEYTCVIDSADMIKCWGQNASYQTSNALTYSTAMVQVPGITKAIDVYGGVGMTCVIDETAPGTRVVKCWGRLEVDAGTATPQVIAGIPNDVTSIYTSGARTSRESRYGCALTESKKVFCWGHNDLFYRGTPTVLAWTTANEVSLLSAPVRLSVGNEGACVVGEDTYLYCWGRLFPSMGSATEGLVTATPVKMTSVGAGVLDVQINQEIACALMSDTKMKCWGFNIYGEAGNGRMGKLFAASAIAVGDHTQRYSQVIAGEGSSCALTIDGKVRCWGLNSEGQLGYGTMLSRFASTTNLNLTNIIKISGNYRTYCALNSSGRVFCWGSNVSGNLGSGSSPDTFPRSASPNEIPIEFNPTTPGIEAAIDLAVGPYHSCAVESNGTVKCWGSNSDKQSGHNGVTGYSYPVIVAGLTGIEKVAVGNNNTCVVKSDAISKSIWCWGNGEKGINGPSAPLSNNHVPQLVETIATTKAVNVFISENAACYIHDGIVKCWGYRTFPYDLPEIGSASQTITTPTEVPSLAGATSMVLSWGGGCATFEEGIKCWGNDPERHIVGDSIYFETPTIAYSFKYGKAVNIARSYVVNYANGFYHLCAIAVTGDLKCWGSPHQGMGVHLHEMINPPAYVRK